MMDIIAPTDNSVADWVAERIPDIAGFDQHDVSLGIMRDGKLLAAVVYHGHEAQHRNCMASFASDGPGWASRRTVAAVLYPPFRMLDCRRTTALIRKKNRKSRKMVEAMGFQLEGTIRKGFGDENMLIYGLMDYEAAKWLERYDEQG